MVCGSSFSTNNMVINLFYIFTFLKKILYQTFISDTVLQLGN